MARRRRLLPPGFAASAEDFAAPLPGAAAPAAGAPDSASALPFPVPAGRMPPIARIAGQSASEAALESLAEDLRRARAEGRMVLSLALEEVDDSYLVRDRLAPAPGAPLDDEMQALVTSLRLRGQQVPVDVVDLGAGAQPRYGLISGWRRLTALRHLAAEGHAPAVTVQALLRRPENAAAAYRAMVEENEIRAGLSYYERARIVARAVDQGVFSGAREALSELFAAASRARRSKIGSFLKIHDALDGSLRFPAALPERLGLELARALEDPSRPEFTRRLRDRLRKTPPASVAEEQSLLARALRDSLSAPGGSAGGAQNGTPDGGQEAAPLPGPLTVTTAAGPVTAGFAAGKVVLSGAGVTPGLQEKLRLWLEQI